jgi:hypothetical protein
MMSGDRPDLARRYLGRDIRPTEVVGVDPCVPGSETWALELLVGGWRVRVRPMVGIGAPYRLEVLEGERLVTSAIGAPSVELALETAATALALVGVPVNRWELGVIGRRFDGSESGPGKPREANGADRGAPEGSARGGGPR